MKDKKVIARYVSRGLKFEIIVDAEKAKEYKQGKISEVRDILVSDAIFRNIRTTKTHEKVMMMDSFETAERVKDEELQNVFGTNDFLTIADKILKEGEIQLTTEQRREMIEQRKRRIISFIANEAMDPKTRLPHPPQRIEIAMDQVKVRIDPFKSAEAQAKDIIKQINSILPISIEKKKLQLKIPVEFSGKSRHVISNFSSIIKETWSATEWIVIIEISAGSQSKLLDNLNSITHGRIGSEEVK